MAGSLTAIVYRPFTPSGNRAFKHNAAAAATTAATARSVLKRLQQLEMKSSHGPAHTPCPLIWTLQPGPPLTAQFV